VSPAKSRTLRALPTYPLAGFKERRLDLEAKGVDVIDLGAGDADLAPPPAVVQAIRDAVGEPTMSRYPFQVGLPAFRQEISGFMEKRFGVTVDPWTEVLPLIGSKEGIAHLPLAFLDSGDVGIVPDPGYQAYLGGTLLAGGEAWTVPLVPEHDFLVPLETLPAKVVERARILFLNYPNNPTSASAPDSYFRQAIDFCREHDVVLVHDHAYSEIAFNGYRPPSVLEYDGAREVAIEFHSLSKTYNMTGWRLGWAVGNPALVAALTQVKTFVDTGVFLAVQAAGVAALRSWDAWVPGNVAVFQGRRDRAVGALSAAGFEVSKPRATMYLWIPVPTGEPSRDFARRCLDQEGVMVLPGAGLGDGGEGFFRVALTVPEARLEEAAARLARVL
jgi:LL-diaminopimelate aminotransferase